MTNTFVNDTNLVKNMNIMNLFKFMEREDFERNNRGTNNLAQGMELF